MSSAWPLSAMACENKEKAAMAAALKSGESQFSSSSYFQNY